MDEAHWIIIVTSLLANDKPLVKDLEARALLIPVEAPPSSLCCSTKGTKVVPKVYRISCHWSLAIPSYLNPVLLLQMDCSLHSSWLPTLISFVLLQLVGAPTKYYLVYEVLNAAIRLPLNHYGYDLMIWRTWLLKSFYEELLCFATGLFTSSSLVLLGYCIFLVTCLTLSRLIWNLTSAPFFELVIQHKTRFNFFEKRWR